MSGIFEFSGFKIDVEKRELYNPVNQTVYLNSRSFDCLLFLVDNRGKILSKQDLLDGVWKNQVVEENNISQAIFNIRKALGDSKANSRFVQTIQGAGYSFIADVNEIEELPEALENTEVSGYTSYGQGQAAKHKKSMLYPYISRPQSFVAVAAAVALVLGIVFIPPILNDSAESEVVSSGQQPAPDPAATFERTRQGGISAAEMLFRNDTNQDGVVSKEEALALESRLGQYFDLYDLNKDGKIVFEELNSVIATRE